MRTIISILISLVMGLGISLVPAQVQAANITIAEEIYQDGPEERVKFDVNTDYDNIVAFAVSHSEALEGNAGIDEDLVPPEFAAPPEDWYGTTIEWDEDNSNWKEYSTDRVIDWLGAGDLPTYQGAWLFTCYDDDNPYDGYGDALWSPGTTGGFYGITSFSESEFAAYDNGLEITLTGDTAEIPIHSSVWLLGSGLVGLVGFRRMIWKA